MRCWQCWSWRWPAAALRLRFSENITGFFPDGERKAAAAFSNLKIKDKIAVMINARRRMQKAREPRPTR